jgi:ABC-type nickel/cobalt efflux system permease component RcnA
MILIVISVISAVALILLVVLMVWRRWRQRKMINERFEAMDAKVIEAFHSDDLDRNGIPDGVENLLHDPHGTADGEIVRHSNYQSFNYSRNGKKWGFSEKNIDGERTYKKWGNEPSGREHPRLEDRFANAGEIH